MSPAALLHLVGAIAWPPLTVLIFALNLENSVWILLIISTYANMKTDWGSFHAAMASARENRRRRQDD